MNTKYNRGISIVVCCYNSSKRIIKTLETLSKQQCSVPWEIIIVDNASTDRTSSIALETWNSFNVAIDMHIVAEPLAGLEIARRKGISESSFSTILFCDDDNWLSENYAQGAFDILESDHKIAACGGMGVPVFETKEPYWFYEYAEAFALGSQEINAEDGQLLNLYGAGLAIKKRSLNELYESGFDAILKDRVGEKLSSSGDTELTYLLVLMGYKLVCSNELKFFHYLSKERLTFEYLQKLFIAFGNDGPVRNLYYSFISKRTFHRLIKNWNFHFILSLFRLIKYAINPPKKYGRSIYFNWNIAYIRQLCIIRKKYPLLKMNIEKITHSIKNKSVQTVRRNNELCIKMGKRFDFS